MIHRQIFDMLNNAYSKYYAPSEHVAVDEVIVLFKWRVIFEQHCHDFRGVTIDRVWIGNWIY
jgi:hypothetical protein